jgi:hypothetical protein
MVPIAPGRPQGANQGVVDVEDQAVVARRRYVLQKDILEKAAVEDLTALLPAILKVAPGPGFYSSTVALEITSRVLDPMAEVDVDLGAGDVAIH